ncbi:glycosyltransferase family 87 protein [Flaviaesturariibacter amylovorans]|uniref:Glycosyltransferase family 87 protein n=1 Tax=Flaviaesturariibacter amylovorans TaxID=1084520 RepID=A0ABP8HPH3_9BACT
MTAIRPLHYFRSGSFLYDRRFALLAWFGLSIFAVLRVVARNEINIYVLYRYVIQNMHDEKNLYLFYPQLYDDQYMYGPAFAVLMLPFSWLPDKIGAVCWVLLNVTALFAAIRKLPIPAKWQYAMLIFCSHELMNASSWLQINALICACIIFGFSYIHEGKEGRALFFIMTATFFKIYGIVGFAFFFFSRRKLAFIGWAALWSVVLFVSPLILISWPYLLQCYRDWGTAIRLKELKNVNLNIGNLYQDISVMGMIRRIFGLRFDSLWVMAPAALLFLSQYAPFRYWSDVRYRLYLLCSLLLFTVIYSSGAESPTYIIALPGICIWYLLQPRNKWTTAYFVFALFLTTFSYSDLFTPWLRVHVLRPYSLKALPSTITWFIILVQIHRRQFLRARMPFADESKAPIVVPAPVAQPHP